MVSFSLMGGIQSSAAITLDELIYGALQTYPTILSKQASKEAASSDVTAAKLRFLPNPSVGTQRNQVAYNGQSSSSLPATNVTISQPLFMGGGLIAGYNKADARLSAADFALLETREDVSKRLISSYAEWLKAWFKIQALEENVKLHEKFVGLITRRYDQGVASGADKDLGNSRLNQARAELDTQRSIEESTLSTISELVGMPVRRADLLGKLETRLNVPPKADGIQKGLANSVTIQRYKFEAEAADAEAKEVRAQALPQVSFQAQRQIGNAYLPGAQGYDMYGLVLSYAPGGGISSIASASAASDRARAATMQVEAAKRDLTDKLNAEYNEHDFALLKKESLQRSVDLSGDISASYDRQFLVGKKSWLDLMNAVRERAQTRVQLADADGSLIGSSRRLLIYINGTQQFDSVKP
jgi:adhesin transport system outer membrane protein